MKPLNRYRITLEIDGKTIPVTVEARDGLTALQTVCRNYRCGVECVVKQEKLS